MLFQKSLFSGRNHVESDCFQMNKLLVVTGGSRGIGRAIAEKFASQGFDVVTCGRKQGDLDHLADSLRQINPDCKVYTQQSDLSKREEVTAFVDFVKGLDRDVEVLVNNTGVFLPGQILGEDEGIMELTMQTNLYSAYHIVRGLVPRMVEKKAGYVFNICSTASIQSYINGGSYCISKHAMLGMNKGLREELKEHDVKVTAVLPGPTLTSSWDGVDLPPERFIKPEDVAETVFATYSLSPYTVVEELLIRPQLGDL